jgi:glyoxalase family protein
MSATSSGIHHITSIASDPRENLRFYTQELGLRFVKKTVNFDDPGTYHLYFGDRSGSPGSIMTFFPWPGVKRGRHGTGQAEEVGYAVPKSSIAWWIDRLNSRGIAHEGPVRRFSESVIALTDGDGHLVELVGTDWAGALPGHDNGDIPAEHAVRGFSGVTLWLDDGAATAELLVGVFGFAEAGEDAGRRRFVSGPGGIGTAVDIRAVGGYPAGALGAGIVHHVAFRAADDAAQAEMAEQARAIVRQVTPQVDRNYFRSVYFREPGGVLFEIATDDPGFAVDEPVETLGEALKLPPQYEPHRDRIEAILPEL